MTSTQMHWDGARWWRWDGQSWTIANPQPAPPTGADPRLAHPNRTGTAQPGGGLDRGTWQGLMLAAAITVVVLLAVLVANLAG